MTKQEFMGRMNDLISIFSKNSYPEPKIAIFWEKLKNSDFETFSYAVSELIVNSSRAPQLRELYDKMAEFREMVAKKKVDEENKQVLYSPDSRDGSSFDKKDIRGMIHMLTKKIDKKITKQEFGEYIKSVSSFVESSSNKNTFSCKKCQDKGHITKQFTKNGFLHDYIFRCTCFYGDRWPSFPFETGEYKRPIKPVEQTFKKTNAPRYYGD